MFSKIETAMRTVLLLSAATFIIASLYSPSTAQAASPDTVRVMMLDRCVNDEYRRQGNSDGVAKRCQCASKQALEKLSPAQIKGATYGKPVSRPMRRELLVALQQCK